jgi:hypothetical protein
MPLPCTPGNAQRRRPCSRPHPTEASISGVGPSQPLADTAIALTASIATTLLRLLLVTGVLPFAIQFGPAWGAHK